ncbi:MAG TPA: hypothetical protein VND45_10665, partial [Thermoanaerobaculia bacterium]|nr:hypothetical protein [Thermoanaerobaculia bacterium]
MRNTMVALAAVLALATACSKQEAKQTKANVQESASKVAAKVGDAIDVAVPLGDKDDPAAREKERFDDSWRGALQNTKVQAPPPQQAPQTPPPPEVKVTFVANGKEKFGKPIDPNALNNAPVVIPIKGDMSGPSVLKTQVYLDRLHFSVGALDGRWGRNSAIALWWYQRSRGINAADAGALDEPTFRSLATAAGGVPALKQYTLTEADLKGPYASIPEDMYEKAKLDCLCYETLKEKLAEQFHTTQEFLDQLNDEVKFADLKAGDSLWVPNVREELNADRPDIARVVVSIRGNTFNAFDAAGNLIFHAPTTLGSKYD